MLSRGRRHHPTPPTAPAILISLSRSILPFPPASEMKVPRYTRMFQEGEKYSVVGALTLDLGLNWDLLAHNRFSPSSLSSRVMKFLKEMSLGNSAPVLIRLAASVAHGGSGAMWTRAMSSKPIRPGSSGQSNAESGSASSSSQV